MTAAFDTDLAIAHLTDSDEVFGQLARRAGRCTLAANRRQTPFQALLRAIVFQQLSGRVAAAIHARLLERLPRRTEEQIVKLLAMKDDEIRAAGLSRAKVAAVKDLAAKCCDGSVPPRRALNGMDDETIIERLTAIRGVGRWTAEMLLMFNLGRPDVFPATDYGVRKGFALAFGCREMPVPKTMIARAERWKPYRSVASWYLWRAVDLDNDGWV